jgi:hypothetical protein
VFLFVWLVVKITFTLSPHQDRFIIEKRGVFRSSKLEFVLSETTLHYFRSHFSEEHAWLGLVVKERHQFFKVFSWKGRGNQRDRFLRLFQHLQDELIRCQSLQHQQQHHLHTSKSGGLSLTVLGGLMYWTRESTEIISKQEFTLIGPFSTRLRQLLARQTGHQVLDDISSLQSGRTLYGFSTSSSLAAAATAATSDADAESKRSTSESQPSATTFSSSSSLLIPDLPVADAVSAPALSSSAQSRTDMSSKSSDKSYKLSDDAGKRRKGPASKSSNTPSHKSGMSPSSSSSSISSLNAKPSRKSAGPAALPPIPPPTSSSSRPLCIEDIPIINYDTFFGHFRFKRRLGVGAGQGGKNPSGHLRRQPSKSRY